MLSGFFVDKYGTFCYIRLNLFIIYINFVRMEKKIYDLQSADWEKTVEMHCLLNKDLATFRCLLNSGYGIYPEVLTLMISLGFYSELKSVLAVAKKYNTQNLYAWLFAFYGKSEWKQVVIECRLENIAQEYFSSEECAEVGFWDALKWKSDWKSKDLLVKQFGIRFLFQICDRWRMQIADGDYTQEIQERFDDLEHYLMAQGEFTYLYEHKAWKTLCRKIEAYRYLDELEDYAAIMSCVEVGHQLNYDTKVFIRTVLRNALDKMRLNEAQKERCKRILAGSLLNLKP